MARRPPRVPHSSQAKARREAEEAQRQADADARRAAEAEQQARRASEAEPPTDAIPTVEPAPEPKARRNGTRDRSAASTARREQMRARSREAGSAASKAARRGAASFGAGVKRARAAVEDEMRADLAGERLPGGARRKGKADPEDRIRRLRERVALEGAIRDPGERVRQGRGVVHTQAARTPVPARSLSTRVVALALILIVSGFMLFPATTTYVRQRAELAEAQQTIDQEQAQQKQLQEQIARWDDQEYVKQQARERLGRAVPGEKQYIPVGKAPPANDETVGSTPAGEYRQGLPWGDGIWDSVVRASHP